MKSRVSSRERDFTSSSARVIRTPVATPRLRSQRGVGKATFLEIDVADDANVTTAAREFAKVADHLDVLVNNAGIIVDRDNGILEISDELLRKTLETNTLGALRVTRAFVPLLRSSKAPRVINVSSGGGQLTGGADGWSPAYCISKTA